MAEQRRSWTKFGRYALLQKIGSGGMAEIYRAKTFGAAGFEKEFAIKLILPSLIDDTEFVDMFINEAKIAVSLYHANIVQVFDLGQIEEQYFIAMEYVYGKDLLDVLARCAELNIKVPLNLVIFIAMEMLKGLDFAHRAKDSYGDELNIIHRDVSPSNILISYAGDVKVGDFGVAKAAIERTLTESGTLKGKVGYMSPEQVMGEAIDSRSDVFSASIVFFEALSMNRLFVGSSDLDVMLKVRDADIGESLVKCGPLPSDLLEIVNRGLARYREDRYQTAGEFYQDLVDFSFRHSIKVTGSDLSNFMRRLFAEEIEAEKTQRRSEPGGPSIRQALEEEEKVQRRASAARVPRIDETIDTEVQEEEEEPQLRSDSMAGGVVLETGRSRAEKKKFRYKDSTGVIFGPMGSQTLADLLRVRRPKSEDRISVNEGHWLPLGEVRDQDLVEALRPIHSRKRVERGRVNTEVAEQGRAIIRQMRREVGQIAEESDNGAGESFDSSSVSDEDVVDTSLSLRPPPLTESVEQELGDQISPFSQNSHVPLTAGASSTDGLVQETFRELKEQYASYEGELENVSFARILGRLHLAKETGRLHVAHGETEKSIFFHRGEPIFVVSNRKEELLGNFLLQRKLISREELQVALERLSEWGGRLGDALVAIGAIPAHSIFEHLSAQMREKLLEVFDWEVGRYSYYENQEPDTKGYPLGLDTYQVIVEGLRERVPLERIKRAYRNRSLVGVYRNAPPPFSVDRLGLRARELRVLHQLQSGETLQTLLGKYAAEQHELVRRTVYLLHQVEVISFEVTERVDLPPVP